MSEPLPIPNMRGHLALHCLSEATEPGERNALLLLHPLGASAAYWRPLLPRWPGAVYALDFSGHGSSPPPTGRCYSPEILAGDADSALTHLGRATLAGAGIGAYVALLVAGARAEEVPVALLVDGNGLCGGGAEPRHPLRVSEPLAPLLPGVATDPAAVESLSSDIRPPGYAREIADSAARLVFIGAPANECSWWREASASPNAERAETDLQSVLDALQC